MAADPTSPRRAVWSLVGSNLFTLFTAWWFGWTLFDLLWPYYLQNLVIGVYASRRIRALRQFTTEGFTVNGRTVAATPENRDRTAFYLLVHFGLFHAGYLIFLLGLGVMVANEDAADGEIVASLAVPGVADYALYLLIGGTFWLGHHQAHAEQVVLDRGYRPNIGALMFLPYLLVLPMHLALLFGIVLGGAGVLLFGLLKTAADVAMHVAERRLLQRSPAATAN